MTNVKSLWEDLRNIGRAQHGRLTVTGWDDEDYEDLYDFLLDELSPMIGDDYDGWYTRHALAYYRHRMSSAVQSITHVTQYHKPLVEQTIREQLVTLKFYIYRRANSDYKTKAELLEGSN